MTQTPTVTLDNHIESIRTMLHDLEVARRSEQFSANTMYEALRQLASNLRRDFPDAIQQLGAPVVTEASMGELLQGYLERVNTRRQNIAPTGIGMLDRAFNGGLQGQRLIALLGAPGSGKTSLANQIAERVAAERPVLYVTSEDTPDILIAKTIARVGAMNYGAVVNGREDHQTGIQNTIRELGTRVSARLLHYVDVTSGRITHEEIRERARTHFADKAGPGLIVIDYLQRLARALSSEKDLREVVTTFTADLRAIACELDCTVLALTSMNRVSGYGKNGDVSILAAAKESGDIEYCADVMMGITEDSSTNRRATSEFLKPRLLRIDKNRIGPETIIELDWYAERQQFTEAPMRGR